MLLAGVRGHAVQREQAEPGVGRQRGAQCSDPGVHGPVDVEQGVGRDHRVGLGLRPQQVTAAVALAEDAEEQVPLGLREEPARELALAAGSLYQPVADRRELRMGLVDGDLEPHRMQAEAAPDLPRELRAVGMEGAELIVRAPVHHLDAALEPARERHRHVEHAHAHALARERVPEGLARQPVGRDPPDAHGRGVPLQVVVHAVLPGRGTRVEGRPDRSGEEARRGLESAQRALLEEAAEVRQPGSMRLDEGEVAGVDADESEPRAGERHGGGSYPPRLRRAAAAAR